MNTVAGIFDNINKILDTEGQNEFVSIFFRHLSAPDDVKLDASVQNINYNYEVQKSYLQKIFIEIDNLAEFIKKDSSILVSVKNQKLLRTCYQLITSLGLSYCLLPGLGISLSKRCSAAVILPADVITDEQKYDLLTTCTAFFTRSYEVPVLKNIIITTHLSDYLAALIQLSFAPLKKPGIYKNFTMTQTMYNQVTSERLKYIKVYEHLVENSFQPILMKELLVLQSVSDPSPPAFAKRMIAKEMSRRLLAPGGLLSLIRCFVETYDIDTGLEWKKIDMICKIVTAIHGNVPEEDYLKNICTQLSKILCLNNTHYLSTAVSCVLSLNEKYPHNSDVKLLMDKIFQSFSIDALTATSGLPGTMILTPQEVDHKINVLHACVCAIKLDYPSKLLSPNLYILFLIGVKCTKNNEMIIKVKEILIKCLELLDKSSITPVIKTFLFGIENNHASGILVEEFESGVALKFSSLDSVHVKSEALQYFFNLFKVMSDNKLVQRVFESALQILIEITNRRQSKTGKDVLFSTDENPVLLDESDEQYAIILQLLSEVSSTPKIVTALKEDPKIVLDFIEHFIIKHNNQNDECVTISLVLLNTILSYSHEQQNFNNRFTKLIPKIRKMTENDTSLNCILAKESLNLILSGNPHNNDETPFGKALLDVYDNLLPVRAHGIMEITKLIESKDPETISKKHYVFCLLQEQLKDSDSYIYLSCINGIAALGTHCTEDVLQVLCKEFVQISSERKDIETKDEQNKTAELRMKIGDVIVKVTRRLGEMAIVHKTLLLNTILCGCRDDDPLIRTSALSNLAEIALILHYRIGTIIYEVLLCVWGVIESDKAVECRRAAVMVISSLLKGLGKDTLVELKDNLLPIYRTLKELYRNSNEDSIVRLHAQIALEELNHSVQEFLTPELKMGHQIFVLEKPNDILK